ncbi:MAG: sugar ABC transporter ATP-binding protein [Ancylobacter novellus]|uniref:Sugar ABC transporter ATP-binding protein n=1 Tax=Ancylobacter novellus TaxID=921 RepID=A0A2W5R331_ANCNO|nr:MAG: sugar ABC transporter ATP-binding protein [Ancylobacter novellus]
MESAPEILRLDRVTRTFPGVTALKDFSFSLRAGEVHVLLGENGAGKSTLISIVSGVLSPSSGEMRLHGQPASFDSVAAARKAGISAIYQEFSLIPELTVAQNIFLGREKRGRFGLAHGSMRREATRMLADLGFDVDPDARISTLNRARQQMVEIAKGLHGTLRVIIFDEPTASLSDSESERLFELISRLRSRGVGIVYITHRMAEVERLADRVTILRDGCLIATVGREVPQRKMIAMMVGREVSNLYPNLPASAGEEVLRIEGLNALNLRDVSLSLRAGEVLGIAGLVGCGKGDVGRVVIGLTRPTAGRIIFAGHDLGGMHLAARMRAGIYYLPSDRKTEGLVMGQGARFNISVRAGNAEGAGHAGIVSFRRERAMARAVTARVELRPANTEKPVVFFSGGNQQKVLFAKALSGKLRLLILDEPTVGVDVNARAAIYRLIADLAADGVAVLLISSELSEITHLCHRVQVMCEGRISTPLAGDEITERNVLNRMFPSQTASG